jgi:hypothetical protein
VNIVDVMEELRARVATVIPRAYAFEIGAGVPPLAIVTFPDSYEFDATYGRGSDTGTFKVVVVVGKPSERTAVARLGAYCDGSGPESVKAAVEVPDVYTAMDTARLARWTFAPYTEGGTEYLSATADIDVTGKGA